LRPAAQRPAHWAIPLITLLVVVVMSVGMAVAVMFAIQTRWNPLVQWQIDYVVDRLPAKLGPFEAKLFGTQPGPLVAWLFAGAIPSSCGGGVFGVTDEVARKVEKEGLAFLSGADETRRAPFGFARWTATPAPLDPEGGVFEIGMSCMEPSLELRERISELRQSKGGYYSSIYHAEVVVLPRQRLLVYTFAGR